MMSSCWQVNFFPEIEVSPEFENFLEDFFEVSADNYSDDGADIWVGYHSGAFSEKAMLEVAAQRGINLPPYEITRLESQNWLKDYVIEFAPVEVEDFLIYGIHEKESPSTAKIPLQIYAATAFGSDHQTTRGCLKAICDLSRQQYQPLSILDVGTGSGILSLAAAKLWPQSQIIAVDIDEESVLVTASNAQTNEVSAQISTAVSDGYQASLISENSPYDLILANILARPLISMAPDCAAALKSGGYCILSGFVEEQEDWVIAEHQKHGLQLEKLYRLDNWRAALMKKV